MKRGATNPVFEQQRLGSSSPCDLPLAPQCDSSAFTLLELLVVIGLIGILAGIGLNSLKGFGESNAIAAANRQLLDDLSFARLRAIYGRSTVYMVFVSPSIASQDFSALNADERKQVTNLLNGQYTSYALFSKRTVGDQPGQEHPRYLTDWRSLPDGVFVATNKYQPLNTAAWQNWGTVSGRSNTNRPFAHDLIPFPTATNLPVLLPYMAFDFQGRLLSKSGDPMIPWRDDEEIIPLARGSIIYPETPAGALEFAAAEVIETPRGNSTNNPNRIHIDWLTGRARVVLPQLPP